MNKTKFFLCISAVIIVAIAAAGFYTASLNDAVDVNMMVNVDELMRHDLNTINGHISGHGRIWNICAAASSLRGMTRCCRRGNS